MGHSFPFPPTFSHFVFKKDYFKTIHIKTINNNMSPIVGQDK